MPFDAGARRLRVHPPSRLAFREVPRQPATLEVTRQGYRVLDERSANGAFVRGRRVTDATLVAGETFRLGQRWMQIVDDRAAAPGDATRSSGMTCDVVVGALLIYLARDRWIS